MRTSILALTLELVLSAGPLQAVAAGSPMATKPDLIAVPPKAGRVATPATLAAILAAAKPGDTIRLADGAYGDLALTKPVTMTGSARAVFNSLKGDARLSGSRFSGFSVLFAPTTTSNSASSALWLVGTSAAWIKDVQLTNITLRCGVSPPGSSGASAHPGQLIGRDATIVYAQDILLTNVDASLCLHGIVLGNGQRITIKGGAIHDVRTTPIDASMVDDLTIDSVHLHDSVPYGTDHADMIHFFTSRTQTGPTQRLKIVGNLIEQGAGAAVLGINTEDQFGMGFTDVVISKNQIHLNNTQGIILSGVRSGVVQGNSLSPVAGLDDPKHAPTIIARKTTLPGAVTISGNIGKLNKALAPFGANSAWTDAQVATMGKGVVSPASVTGH